MGMCQSAEVRAQATRAAVIEKQLEIDRINEQMTVKLLLLGKNKLILLNYNLQIDFISFKKCVSSGAGECGKSTILKQMQ
jgi:hypothetical protein